MVSVPVFVECAYCCSELDCAVIVEWAIESSARGVVPERGAVVGRVSGWVKSVTWNAGRNVWRQYGWIGDWG